MYSKEVTAIIMQDWGKGASAEEYEQIQTLFTQILSKLDALTPNAEKESLLIDELREKLKTI
jgi:hypothetical protein